MEVRQIPLPIVITKENKWFVAACPILGLASQGRTEREVKENITDLIEEYLKDPDTPKPDLNSIMNVSLTNVQVKVPEGVLNRKASNVTSA